MEWPLIFFSWKDAIVAFIVIMGQVCGLDSHIVLPPVGVRIQIMGVSEVCLCG